MRASDCKCTRCGKQAVAFWPLIDPDIPAEPFCRKCLDKAKVELFVNAFGYSDKDAKAMVKYENWKRHEQSKKTRTT